MIRTVQRKIQSPILICFCYEVPSSQSGGEVSDSYIREILAQMKGKKQNYFNPEAGISDELSLVPPLSAEKKETPGNRAFSCCVDDAIRRYKKVNHTDEHDKTPAEIFLSTLELFSTVFIPRISFYSDAVKAKINFNQREFTIDYDYEAPDSIFISTFEGDKLIMKDAHVNELYTILGSF
jgi:hypothetical protein